MPTKKNTNKLSQLYRTIDQKELSKEALDTLAKLRLATANFRKQEGKEVDAFKLFFDRLIKNKPTAVKTTPEYKAMIKERRSENGRKAMEARKAKQESRQGQGSERDAARPAKPFGWRLRGKHNYRKPTRADIRSGRAYYEARINRADSQRTKFPMLERGGFMEHGGEMDKRREYFQGTISDDALESILNYEYPNHSFSIEAFSMAGTRIFGKKVDLLNVQTKLKDIYKIKSRFVAEVNFMNPEFLFVPSELIYFAKGGAIKNQYEDRTPEDIWDSYTKEQKLHFLYDHREEINEYKAIESEDEKPWFNVAYKSNWDDLDMQIKNRFANHVRGGQYADGGYMEHGGRMKGDTLENVRAIAKKMSRNQDVYVLEQKSYEFLNRANAKDKSIVREFNIGTQEDVDYIKAMPKNTNLASVKIKMKYSKGELKSSQEELIFSNESKMAQGGVFYTDSHKQGH